VIPGEHPDIPDKDLSTRHDKKYKYKRIP
jgi:hypothetical protein